MTIDPGTTSGTVPSRAQVVIVGGGVTGCSIACHLAHLGWTDTVPGMEEKGYHDMGVDIDNTDNPIEAGLGFAVAWDKPGGFIGRDALLKAREQGPPRHGVVSLVVDDPAADLFGNEPVLAGGEWAGYVRAAAYGYTVGGPVGLAQVASDDGVTGQWLKEADFRVRTPDGEVPARLQIAPPYDPQRLRILDR